MISRRGIDNMSAEDRLQAPEQVVPVMHSEVISAKTAAAQDEQRASDAETRVLGVRGEGVVDTRLLGKPKSIDGTTDSWRQFKFTFLGYDGAVDSTLRQVMIEREVLQEYAIVNSALPAREGSAQRLLEHAGDLSCRRLGAEYELATVGSGKITRVFRVVL